MIEFNHNNIKYLCYTNDTSIEIRKNNIIVDSIESCCPITTQNDLISEIICFILSGEIDELKY